MNSFLILRVADNRFFLRQSMNFGVISFTANADNAKEYATASAAEFDRLILCDACPYEGFTVVAKGPRGWRYV